LSIHTPCSNGPSGARRWGLALTLITTVVALGLAASSLAEAPEFELWLAELRADAVAKGISEATLDAGLSGLKPIERVIELDRNQPEFTLTLDRYLSNTISERRVARGRDELWRHRVLLRKLHEQYGVQPRYVIALWGVESSYGRNRGSYPVIGSLATLAWEGRRGAFFRGELLEALRILDAGHVSVDHFLGSWSGAMGQPQFMPSSFKRFAVDHDGDGRRDIWDTTGDVLASIANYLAGHDWADDHTWGREVRLPRDFDPAWIGRTEWRTLPEWQALGLRRADGSDLPTRPLRAAIVRPDENGSAYVVYENFGRLMRWNSSEYFGIAVGTLSDSIAGR